MTFFLLFDIKFKLIILYLTELYWYYMCEGTGFLCKIQKLEKKRSKTERNIFLEKELSGEVLKIFK